MRETRIQYFIFRKYRKGKEDFVTMKILEHHYLKNDFSHPDSVITYGARMLSPIDNSPSSTQFLSSHPSIFTSSFLIPSHFTTFTTLFP